MTVAVVLKAILLALESKEKRTILFGHYRASAPECTAGLLNQWFCWWLNPLLVKGYRQMHSLETLLEVDTDLYIQDKDDTRLSEFWLLCW